MSTHRPQPTTVLIIFLLIALLAGCAQPAAQSPTGQPPTGQLSPEVLQPPTAQMDKSRPQATLAGQVEILTEEMEMPAAEAAASLPNAGSAPLNAFGALEPPNDLPYIDNYFENYGVNPFIDVEDDPLSTFALDVDTGSYTVGRRFLQDGYLPDKDSVRVEEYVNYFKHAYPYPPEGQAFALQIDGAPSPYGEGERYQMLRIGVQGYAVPAEARKDVSLTFVIDVSGSMDMENRLELVKQSLELLVGQLHARDRVSIVVYGSDARFILEPTPGDQKETILAAIYALRPEGSTNAEAGLKLGYQAALRAFNPAGINRVILCSDGVANVGNTGAGSIWDQIKTHASEGVTLTTVGFGMGNYNDVLMEQLADNGEGFYAYVDTINEAERLFVGNLTSALQVIGLDAKIQVDFNPQVVARYRLVGFENRAVADEDFRNDAVDAGEIGAGHSVTALYEVKLHPEAAGTIAAVYLRWEDPDTHEVNEINRAYNTAELAPAFYEAASEYQRDVLVAEFAEILRQSYWAQGGSLDALVEEALRLQAQRPDDADLAEFVELARRAAALGG